MEGPREFIRNWMDRRLPAIEDCADIHHALAGVTIAAAGVGGEQIIATIERQGIDNDPITFMAGAAGFFWNRGWQARGE